LGQCSIPVLNRSGYFMFWTSSWDDLHSFHVKFKEDIFIRRFVNYIFEQKSSSKSIFFLNLKIKNNIFEKYNINVSSATSVTSFSNYLFKLSKSPYYLSSIRIIRYQQWLVIYFYILSPFSKKTSSTFSETKFANFYKQSFKSYLHILKKLNGISQF
jgi:hypothetical protein